MSKETKKYNVSRMRVGHEKTGFSFVLARCDSTDALKAYCAKFGIVLEGDGTPAGICFSRCDVALPGILVEAIDGVLYEAHIVVTKVNPNNEDDDDYDDMLPTLTPVEARRTELRHWRHEIGHAITAIANAGVPHLLKHTYLGKILPQEDMLQLRVEAPAMVAELLGEAVDKIFTNLRGAPQSGLPNLYENLGVR